MTLPSRYGISLGGYKSIPKELVWIDFTDDAGLHTEKAALNLLGGESPGSIVPATLDLIDGFRHAGGLMPGDGFIQWGNVLPDPALQLIPFQAGPSKRYVVAIRTNRWSYSIGGNWTELGGSTNPAWDGNIYSVVLNNLLIVAVSPLDRLKSWDGDITHPIVDLSPDAPRAQFIAALGNRLIAAGIRDAAGNVDGNLVAWSADNALVTNWTSADLGAGSAVILSEVGGSSGDPIIGLSTSQSGGIIYRQNSMVLISRTGINDQPFRFTTIVRGLGLFQGSDQGGGAGYRIAKPVHIGMALGDIFVGGDLNVYLFNPPNQPIPIGDPIWKALLSSPPANLTSGIRTVFNAKSNEYTLAGFGGLSYTMDLRQLVTNQKLVWRRTGSISNLFGIGYNDIPDIGSGVGVLIAKNPGTTILKLVRPEETVTTSGPNVFSYVSKVLGSDASFVMVSSMYVPYELFANVFGTTLISMVVSVYISTDGGDTWVALGVQAITSPTHWKGFLKYPVYMRLSTWQFRLDVQPAWGAGSQNNIRVPKIGYYVDRGGRA